MSFPEIGPSHGITAYVSRRSMDFQHWNDYQHCHLWLDYLVGFTSSSLTWVYIVLGIDHG